MRHELTERLEGYGWVDEAAGIVHIPIDEAIRHLADQGVDGRAALASTDVAPEAQEPTDE